MFVPLQSRCPKVSRDTVTPFPIQRFGDLLPNPLRNLPADRLCTARTPRLMNPGCLFEHMLRTESSRIPRRRDQILANVEIRSVFGGARNLKLALGRTGSGASLQ